MIFTTVALVTVIGMLTGKKQTSNYKNIVNYSTPKLFTLLETSFINFILDIFTIVKNKNNITNRII